MVTTQTSRGSGAWPRLRVEEWTATRETLHMWTQIVGKVRLVNAPLVNHWWQVTFYVSPRGLTTSAIPYGTGVFDAEFDFVEHVLRVRTSDGGERLIPLESVAVADFYGRVLGALEELGVPSAIQGHPNEVEPAIPFARDRRHHTYDPRAAHLFWQQLLQADRVLGEFRGRFAGKVSPVHLFWGAMDLACTRFSGRGAPRHPGGAPNCADWVMVEGYSRELSSAGFWPGGGDEGSFYSYAYPEPEGYAQSPVTPGEAFYSRENGQFLLPYEAVRQAADPDRTLSGFLQSTYEAAAVRGGWDRAALEVDPSRWRKDEPHG